ncbi:MAG: porin family protein [Hyphomicrobiales bacterium]|nr:porin family protein [Hyphomicrobiales bacterium]
MKKLLTGLLLTTSVVALASGSRAEDVYTEKKIGFNWSGIYGGVVGAAIMHAGGMPGTTQYARIGKADGEISDWGGAIGVTGGINFQDGNFVYGIEGDISWSDLSNSNNAEGSFDSLLENEWNGLATLRARAGIAIDNTLAYVSGGVALVDVDQSLSCGATPCTAPDYYDFYNSGWEAGIAAGAGVEHAFTDNLSLKLEYMYVGLPTNTVKNSGLPGFDGANFRSSAHMIRVGLNYKFGNPASNTYAFESGAHNQEMIPHDWSGFYGGIVAADGMFTGQTPGDYSGGYYDIEMSDWGGAVGATAGFNMQDGSFVYGIEGDISWADLGSDPYSPDYNGDDYISKSEWNGLATLRARTGIAVNNTIAYVTGGIALADVDQWVCRNNSPCGTHTHDLHNSGWKMGIAAGAGVEHALTDNMSFKLEYLYVGLPSESVTSEYLTTMSYNPLNFRSQAHLIRAGMNYSFGGSVSNAQAGKLEPHDWTGLYAGFVGGVGMFTGETPAYDYGSHNDTEISDWGATAGVTAGVNFQSGYFVYGVEGDASWSNLGHDPFSNYHDPSDDGYESRSKWEGLVTLRGRIGVSASDTMAYVTGGIALVDVDQSMCEAAGACGAGAFFGDRDLYNSGWQAGIAVGAGVEHAFTDNLSFKMEYLYVGLPTEYATSGYISTSGSEPMRFKSEAHMIRVGVNYMF